MAREMPYPTYIYSYITGSAQVVHSPAAYEPVERIGTEKLGNHLSEPTDLFVDDKGNFYILDKGANMILMTDNHWNVIKEITFFQNTDTNQEDGFNAPEGLCVSADETIYVADTQNSRVVILDKNGVYKGSVTTPKSNLFDDNYSFLPTKVAVDSVGRIYVISRNDYQGILQFNADYSFFGYMGSNQVTFNIVDMIWKKLLTEDQLNQTVQFIPVEYTNLYLDDEEFIYTVSASPTETTPIKLLNSSGDDVLLHAGYSSSIAGDEQVLASGKGTRSTLIDICADSTGTYFALDSSLGHIFAYNSEGFLLYAFGAMGNQIGTFATPTAIEIWKDQLYVLDSETKSISVFGMTEYAREIRNAEKLYNSGKYDESMQVWQRVAKMNGNFELAYAQIGKIQLMQEKYEEAMRNFELGYVRGDMVQQQNGYNKAFTEYRKQFLASHLPMIILIVVAVILIAVAVYWMIKRRKKTKKGAK